MTDRDFLAAMRIKPEAFAPARRIMQLSDALAMIDLRRIAESQLRSDLKQARGAARLMDDLFRMEVARANKWRQLALASVPVVVALAVVAAWGWLRSV